jgi:hypothetical protein
MDSINDFLAMKTVLDDDNHRCYCDDCYCHRRNGLGDTALALGAAGLGIAVLGGFALFGYVNQAQKNAALLTQANGQRITDTVAAIGQLNNTLLNEASVRQANESAMRNEYTTSASRLSDQITITNNAATTAQANSASWASAQASLANDVLSQRFSVCPQEVVLTSKQYCPCPATNCGCGCGCNS